MSSGTPRDLPASIRARLKNRADELGLEFDQASQGYATERFLYRLSKTRWAERLIVKGAVMLRVWDGSVARPTRDIDFLGRIDASPEAVAGAVRDCLSIESDDGIEFSREVATEAIALDDGYPGIRATISDTLSGARIRLRLDIGIGDSVVPDPAWVEYPTLLGMEAPRILAYRPPTAVAEKFEAMISKGLLNSRLKDYYDIWMLARTIEFDGEELRASLTATFGRRGIALPQTRPKELSDEYAARPQTRAQWDAFIGRLELAGVTAPRSLEEVVDAIASFIVPVAAAAAAGDVFPRTWVPGEGWRTAG